MDNYFQIRTEKETDIARIEEIVIAAFAEVTNSSQIEYLIVGDLRKRGALTVSLVAEQDRYIIGHIAFSPIMIDDDLGWFGLGPVAVDPEYQNQGVGAELVQTGLVAINKLGAKGCVVLGSPKYYERFGFKSMDKLKLAGAPPDYFMAMKFEDKMPNGVVEYNFAFTKHG